MMVCETGGFIYQVLFGNDPKFFYVIWRCEFPDRL